MSPVPPPPPGSPSPSGASKKRAHTDSDSDTPSSTGVAGTHDVETADHTRSDNAHDAKRETATPTGTPGLSAKAQAPGVPGAPGAPKAPSAPGAPTSPAATTAPHQAQGSTAPTAPGAPKAPAASRAPHAPSAPAAPGAPTPPGAPTAPAAPGAARQPSAPGAPAVAGGHAPGAAAPTAPRTPGATKPGGPQAPGTKKAGAGTAGGKKTGATTTKKNSKSSKKKREPITIGEKSLAQWGKIAGLTALALIVLGVIVVFTARWLMSLDVVSRWIDKYPGEYAPSPSPDPGFPVWARWQHYVNFFFMLLIIRTGLLVRHQQKPPAVWQSKRGGKKISIFLWLHTSLDILWLANGVVFVVLLFASGHWARLIPTSWKVFPNALSAALQYISFNWPAEHGWENYNSLQQIMYFLVIFVAAPLAVVSGVRMSEWWPKEAQTLNKVYPAPVARHIHYPTMVFFVFFVFVHVLLVFTTGFRENLNHMFAGNDSASWAGFLWFMGGLIIAVAGVMAARPLVLAPIASRFGQVSAR